MQLLRQVWSFGSTIKEMVHLWIIYCRSVLEQSCVVWHSTLSKKNIEDLERTQKSLLVLQNNYINYNNALLKLDIISLTERRKKLNLQWAKKGINEGTSTDLFPVNKKFHQMQTRKEEKFQIYKYNTERTKKSSINYMRHLMNTEYENLQSRKRKRTK